MTSILRPRRPASTCWPSRRRHAWWQWAAPVLAAAALLPSCREPASSKAPLLEGAPVVMVTLEEYQFGFSRRIPAGRVIFRLVNRGREIHDPGLFALADDFPALDEQLRGSRRRVITPFAEITAREPGAVGTFAVDLEAGRRYGFICFARGSDGKAHGAKGMSFEFRAGGGSEAVSGRPPASTTVATAGPDTSPSEGE